MSSTTPHYVSSIHLFEKVRVQIPRWAVHHGQKLTWDPPVGSGWVKSCLGWPSVVKCGLVWPSVVLCGQVAFPKLPAADVALTS